MMLNRFAWQRIDFPGAFQFPVGTNLLTEVTLFAWGEGADFVPRRKWKRQIVPENPG